MTPVQGIVQYPLYMGLPATGGVRSVLEESQDINKTVSLSWHNAGVSQICNDKHTGAPSVPQTCVAGETYRNTSFGADLGWFTLNGDCEGSKGSAGHVKDYKGLCFILANDKIAAADDGIASTLLAQADSRRSCCTCLF